MMYTGLEQAPQEIRDALGKCEVCGAQATSIVTDVETAVVDFYPPPISIVQRRFCDEHSREEKRG